MQVVQFGADEVDAQLHRLADAHVVGVKGRIRRQTVGDHAVERNRPEQKSAYRT